MSAPNCRRNFGPGFCVDWLISGFVRPARILARIRTGTAAAIMTLATERLERLSNAEIDHRILAAIGDVDADVYLVLARQAVTETRTKSIACIAFVE